MRAHVLLLAILLAGCAGEAPRAGAPGGSGPAPPTAGVLVRPVDLRWDNLTLSVADGTVAALVDVTPEMWVAQPAPWDAALEPALPFQGDWWASEEGTRSAALAFFVEEGTARLVNQRWLPGGMASSFGFSFTPGGEPRAARMLFVLATDGSEPAQLVLRTGQDAGGRADVAPPDLLRGGAPLLADYVLSEKGAEGRHVEVEDARENGTAGLRQGRIRVRTADAGEGPGIALLQVDARAAGASRASLEMVLDGEPRRRAYTLTGLPGGAGSVVSALAVDGFSERAEAAFELEASAAAEERIELRFLSAPLDLSVLGVRVLPRFPEASPLEPGAPREASYSA